MSDLTKALGQRIIDGGLARIEADAALYGDPARVVMATARVQAVMLDLAGKAGADPFRIMLANKLGDLAVAALYGGDITAILERGIADIGRLSPIAELQERAAARQESEDLERRIEQARRPAQPVHPATPRLADDGETADQQQEGEAHAA